LKKRKAHKALEEQ